MTQHHRPAPYNILQEYLQALADGMDLGPTARQQKALTSYAELQYQLHGGGRCSMCRASVRHVLPVKAEHNDGTIAEYRCLCTRCLEGERVVSDRLSLTVGNACLEYTANLVEPQIRNFRTYTT
ncbi:MAG: hypothetical protein LAN64_03955 [Acidobacteriia bacterium]|nr:hypothetical protein [Terriglobia bacterium]